MGVIAGVVIRARRNYAAIAIADRCPAFFKNAFQHRAIGMEFQVSGKLIPRRGPGCYLQELPGRAGSMSLSISWTNLALSVSWPWTVSNVIMENPHPPDIYREVIRINKAYI